MSRQTLQVLALAFGLGLALAACTSDSEDPGSGASSELVERFDANGDGTVTIGVAASGSANDGAYNQAIVDAARELSTENGFAEPIVVDEVGTDEAATALADLASQVDIVVIGADSVAGSINELVDEFPDVFWYCNCGAGFPDTPGLATSIDDASEVAYTAGVATALVMDGGESTEVSFIGCCSLPFEKEFLLAFELGLTNTNPELSVTYVPTGDFDFDFNNIANASEALNNAIDSGAGAVMPYLADAHRPIVEAANEAGMVTMSAGASNVCGADEELGYDIAVGFDGGDYIRAVFPGILSGEVEEGSVKRFSVGVDPEPGAVICDATEEQQATMDAVYAQIANGDFSEAFGAIKAEAFG